MIFLLLASLIAIYLRLGIDKAQASTRQKLAVHVPFSVYLGWITIASIANVAVALVAANWGGFGLDPQVWAAVVVVLVLAITLAVLAIRRDVAFALVIIWALVGIGGNQSANQTVFTLAMGAAVVVAVSLVAAVLWILQCRK